MNSAYYFLHAVSGRSWPTDDPHRWLLDRRDDDLLAPARERLLTSPDDHERCLRVVLRRCGLALVHVVSESRIAVRHWTEPAPDLRALAREHGLAKVGVVVTLINEKTGRAVVHEHGADVLLPGERVGDGFPWGEYTAKYERRRVVEADDDDAAPAAYTNFIWPGVPPETLTLGVLKAIWRAESVLCPNCDVPLVTTNFSWQQGPLSFRPARLVRHCLQCRRRFEAHEDKPLEWLASVLPLDLQPTQLRLWRALGIDWSDPPRLR